MSEHLEVLRDVLRWRFRIVEDVREAVTLDRRLCRTLYGRWRFNIASLNPGLMSAQPFRAAGLHAGGVKEISPR